MKVRLRENPLRLSVKPAEVEKFGNWRYKSALRSDSGGGYHTARRKKLLDKMIALVEGASRQKTPNEIALTILLAVFTLVSSGGMHYAEADGRLFRHYHYDSRFLVSLCLSDSYHHRWTAFRHRNCRYGPRTGANVITKSGKAVETAGDVDTLLLDKTGTITIGNRKATAFHPVKEIPLRPFVEICMLSSLADDTPEGKSIIELGREQGIRMHTLQTETKGAHIIPFTAETKCSGVDLKDGTQIRKGAF